MLEDRSCFVSRDYHRERSWACMSFRLDANGKRPAEDDQEDERVRKCLKQSDTRGRVDTALTLGGNSSASEADQAGCDYEADDGMQMTLAQGGGDQHSDGVNSETGAQGGDMVADQAGDQHCDGVNSDTSCLIPGIGRDNSISCLIRCSRSAYGMAASVNRSFRSLIRSGELYKLRRMNGIFGSGHRAPCVWKGVHGTSHLSVQSFDQFMVDRNADERAKVFVWFCLPRGDCYYGWWL